MKWNGNFSSITKESYLLTHPTLINIIFYRQSNELGHSRVKIWSNKCLNSIKINRGLQTCEFKVPYEDILLDYTFHKNVEVPNFIDIKVKCVKRKHPLWKTFAQKKSVHEHENIINAAKTIESGCFFFPNIMFNKYEKLN